MKIIVVLLFIIVLVSLSSGLVFMVKDKGQTHRNVKALTLRVGLSILAFVLLMSAYYAGLIQPHGLVP
ncbi:MAG: twin transmembrane helix small protein [Gammaproteobacteria bacterium]|nr:twin transmembrane helix small protein [Gammaproteobacteria bacterium]